MFTRMGLPESARSDAARLYWAGFTRKLAPVVGGGRTVGVLADALVPAQVMGAWNGDRLVGIACLQDGPEPPLRLDRTGFRREFGILRGGWRRLLSTFVTSRPPGADELLLDVLAVSPEARGLGVGTTLLSAVADEARTRGRHRVKLEVVDTNPRAKALYERFGFRTVDTVRTPYLRRLLGFGAVDTMRYDVP
ncbi:putative acetyltransferase [Actinomadura rubteroloni]|uniref:Putative acetyltransferase n=1 Tax=Actinomadura rubteroloni TaxID=1926885 RepID=A0A2P4UME4_9ACTN|nr:GNAT family N-acetyltransferase [Actinomadura rubteroloni]POM26215.1 putative acetyltransferase [Actinomadura rubteroloni]